MKHWAGAISGFLKAKQPLKLFKLINEVLELRNEAARLQADIANIRPSSKLVGSGLAFTVPA